MRFRLFAALLSSALASAAHAQSLTVRLTSPQDGLTLHPGDPVHWYIDFQASAGDNEGLALLCADLVQSATNPAMFDIPIADAVPVAMTNFSRPAGISNPNNGYRGTQFGTAGARNLVQIGGAQNTFGVAMPAGSGIGESAAVVAFVGQGAFATLATGSFPAPAAPGIYTFSLANVAATVLTDVQAPPNASHAAAVTPLIAKLSLTFTVEPGAACIACDTNCNGTVNQFDIQPFIAALISHTGCSPCAGDANADGTTNQFDITPFLDCLIP